jgi:hypothetical protein
MGSSKRSRPNPKVETSGQATQDAGEAQTTKAEVKLDHNDSVENVTISQGPTLKDQRTVEVETTSIRVRYTQVFLPLS